MTNHKNFPNFWGALLLLIFLIVIQIFIAILLNGLGFKFEAGEPGIIGLILVLSNGILLSFLIKYQQITLQDLFNSSSNSLKSIVIVLGVPIFLVVGSGVFWVSDISTLVMLYYPIDESEYLMLAQIMNGGVVSIILLCIIVPIIEELLFRGVILRSFLFHYSANLSIILSSLLFALYHLDIHQFLSAFLLGCFSGWLYIRTRSLWPSILSHALYNSLIMLLWSSMDNQDYESIIQFNGFEVNILSLLGSFIGIKILIYIFRSHLKAHS